MFIKFFFHLRAHQLPVSLREFLDLLHALRDNLCDCSLETFYALSRSILVKDERYYDKFDQAFGEYVSGNSDNSEEKKAEIPRAWLEKMIERHLSDAEKQQIKALGGFDALMKTLEQRLREQKERHQGGNKWIGTAGTSPFGAYGYNPEGIRIGQEGSRHRRAVKVWDKRKYYNLDEDSRLQQRNMAMALRNLRVHSRQGAACELDLRETIRQTAKNAGYLDIRMQAAKENHSKVLMLFDVGGSMDDHVMLTQALFNQARDYFKRLDYYYFHNCLYESVWKDNHRRAQSRVNTLALARLYAKDYKVIIVGDASMSPYEILYPGGSVEHMNRESGETWLRRLQEQFPHLVWLNPLEKQHWYAQSIAMIAKITGNRMYPLTIKGISDAMKQLS